MSDVINTKFDPFCNKSHHCRDCENRCVNNIAFLRDLPVEFQTALMEHSEYKKYHKDSYIFREGDRVSAVTVIRKGAVKLTTTDLEGHEKIVGIFSENDTIWEGIFLDGSHYPYSAQCLSETHVCKIYKEDFERSVSDPALALNVISMLSNKLHDANERNMILSTSSPEVRIAAFLLYRDRREKGDVIKLRLGDIAASVGLRSETVSRKLHYFIDSGLIERVNQSGIRILDYEALSELVNSN